MGEEEPEMENGFRPIPSRDELGARDHVGPAGAGAGEPGRVVLHGRSAHAGVSLPPNRLEELVTEIVIVRASPGGPPGRVHRAGEAREVLDVDRRLVAVFPFQVQP